MKAAYSIDKQISYRCYDDRCILLHHGRNLVLRLNRSAGMLLDRIDNPQGDFNEQELGFIEALARYEIVREGEAATKVADRSKDARKKSSGSKALDDLRIMARDRLIPISAQIELTHRCSLKCRHCYLQSEKPQASKELSFEELERFMTDLAKMGGLFLLFTGGDVLLRPDFERIFDKARELRFAVSILSSGWKIDPALPERMAASGLDAVQVSLHGPDAQTHEAISGQAGSFDEAWRSLKLFKSLGVNTRAAISVHNENVDKLDLLIRKLEKEKIDYNLNLIMLPMRNGDFAPRRLQLDEKRMASVLRRYPHHSFRMNGLTDADPLCAAGRSLLALNPYGEIHPCLMWPESAGNIREEDFENIWKNSRTMKTARSLHLANLKDCPDCKMRQSCNRCTGLALSEGLGISEHSFLDCAQAKVLYSARMVGKE